MSGDPIFELREITRRAGGAVVLDIGELTIREGELCAVVGSNGAGKTRLLEILSLLEPPCAGEIEFRGRVVFPGSGPSLGMLRHISYVTQDPYLFNTSIVRNVMYGLRRRGMRGAEARSRSREALERVGLADFAHRNARTLSGGELKRAALARALVLEPEVLLLDETCAHVDARNAEIIEGLVRGVRERLGSTVIMATHDLAQAYRLGARVVSLHQGRLVEAPPDNLFSVEIRGGDGVRLARISPSVEIEVATERSGRAMLAVDARHVILSRGTIDSSARNHFAGRVVATEMTGGVVKVTVDIGVELVAFITEESYRSLGIRLGEELIATFKTTAVRVY